MRKFSADLHIHTVLSPCGDMDMSPDVIIAKAKAMNLDIIGITDHNSTLQCHLLRRLGERNQITVITGAEVTTKEEVHCLAFFETDELLNEFQKFLDEHLPDVKNDVRKFGYQLVVDAEKMVVLQEERLLISAIDQNIDQVEEKVHSLSGLFIPAHIDKKRFSIFGQLGFLPPDLKVDALEVSPFCDKEDFTRRHPELAGYCIISGSDAHFPYQIGSRLSLLELENPGFKEIRRLFGEKRGDKIMITN
jgi:3',5'-nucleoside bisphosphate phosphatase